MWFVVSEPTVAVYMEGAQYPQQQQETITSYSPTSSTASTSSMRQQKAPARSTSNRSPRKATTTMRNVTCAPSQVLCRYANKKCSNPRAVKRTGGLHTFCAMHRENANRNQRRLDLRKRLQKQALQSSAQLDSATGALEVDSATPVTLGFIDLQLDNHHQYHSSNSELLYEPLATPTPLRDEDVTTLITLFASPKQLSEDPCCFDDVPMPREPTTLLYAFPTHRHLSDDVYDDELSE